MPVGTVGSVKGVYHRDLKDDIGAEIILGNTYHLYLRPGLEILKAAGGLHRLVNEFADALALVGGDRHPGDAQRLGKLLHVNGAAHGLNNLFGNGQTESGENGNLVEFQFFFNAA